MSLRETKLTHQSSLAPETDLLSSPKVSEIDALRRAALNEAIQRSQNYLLREQKPEGFWVGELMVDATLVADTIAYHHWNGKVDEKWQGIVDSWPADVDDSAARAGPATATYVRQYVRRSSR